MAEPLPTLPPDDRPATEGAQLRAELAALRQRFRMLDDVDLKTSELVGRLAETMQSLVELRARTSLDISATLERIEARIDVREAHQQAVLHGLRDEIASAQRSASSLVQLAATIEASHRALTTRISQHDAWDSEGSVAADPVKAPTPLFPGAGETHAQPVVVAGSATAAIVLRFDQVDSTATALSLQRFVSRIPGVAAVTGRQFVGRTLKLNVTIRGELFYDDLLDWPGGELAIGETSESGASLTVARVRGV